MRLVRLILILANFQHGFDNRSNHIGYGSWVGRKTTGKNVDKAMFTLPAEAFKVKPEVACYSVT